MKLPEEGLFGGTTFHTLSEEKLNRIPGLPGVLPSLGAGTVCVGGCVHECMGVCECNLLDSISPDVCL